MKLQATIFAICCCLFNSPSYAAIYKVKADATGNNDGTTWEHAYTDLQIALGVAMAGDQVWVASGEYKAGTSQSDTFALVDGLIVLGGYLGSDLDPSARNPDPATNDTVLSGEIGDAQEIDDNSYLVVTAIGLQSLSTVLDGFTITRASSVGIYNENSRVNYANLIITDNHEVNAFQSKGAGMLVAYSSAPNIRPIIDRCKFIGNTQPDLGTGGGLAIYFADARITNCVFEGNEAGFGGGLSIDVSANSQIIDCEFRENIAHDDLLGLGGGGAWISSDAFFTRCRFIDNEAAAHGGGGRQWEA